MYLALATVAFAVLMDNTFFTASSIMGTDGNLSVGRPSLFGWHMTSNRSFDCFLAVVLALAIVGVGWLRRSAFGRRLVALNDSPPAFSAMGLSATMTKFLVFALSAGLAGVAGALFGGLGTSVTGGQFVFLESAVLFVAITLAGNTLISAAVVAGIGLAVLPVIGSHVPQILQPQLRALRPGNHGHRAEPQRHGQGVRGCPRAVGRPRHRGSGSGPASVLTRGHPFGRRSARSRVGGHAGRLARATTGMRSALADLQVTELTVHFGGLAALTEVDLSGSCRPGHRADRTERGREDDAIQRGHRMVKPKMGRVKLDGGTSPGCVPTSAPGAASYGRFSASSSSAACRPTKTCRWRWNAVAAGSPTGLCAAPATCWPGWGFRRWPIEPADLLPDWTGAPLGTGPGSGRRPSGAPARRAGLGFSESETSSWRRYCASWRPTGLGCCWSNTI